MKAPSMAALLCVVLGGGVASGAGDLSIVWPVDHGNWETGRAAGEVPANWYPSPADGRVFLSGVSPGFHTIGLTRAFGLGPLLLPNVYVAQNGNVQIAARFHADYFSAPGQRTIRGRVIEQPFVAKGVSVIKAGAFFAEAPGDRGVKYSIREAGSGRPGVGEEAVRPPGLTGRVAVWCHGQVPVTPGRVYVLRLEGAKGALLDVKLSDGVEPMLPLVVDGEAVPGASLAGFVQSDPPGIMTTMACVEGQMRDRPDRDNCEGECGQTFLARGTSLGLVDLRPYVPGVEGEIRMEVIVRRGGTKGPNIGRQVVSGPNGSVLQAVWGPGEVPLSAEEEYAIDIRNPEGGGFKTWRTAGQVYPFGTLVVDEYQIPHSDLDMNIVEYGPDDTGPGAPGARVLSGDGSARVEYTAPEDPDVRKVVIRWREGDAGERWPLNPLDGHLLAEVDVVPGEGGVIHHEGLVNFGAYVYALFAADVNANYSEASRCSAYPGKGPVMPVQSTLLNPGFQGVTTEGAWPPGWNCRVLSGDRVWSSFEERDGVSFGWEAREDAAGEVSQIVSLHPGRRYSLSVEAKGSPGSEAAVYIEGEGEKDVVPLSEAWVEVGSVYESSGIERRFVIEGKTMGEGGIRFRNARIRDMTME